MSTNSIKMIMNNKFMDYCSYKRLKYIIYIYNANRYKSSDYLKEFNFNRVKTSNDDYFRVEPRGIHDYDSTITVETTLSFNTVVSSFVGYLLSIPNLKLYYYNGDIFANDGLVEIINDKSLIIIDYYDRNGYKLINYFKQAFDNDSKTKFTEMLSSSLPPIKNDIYVPPTKQTNTVNLDEFRNDIGILKNDIICMHDIIKQLRTDNSLLHHMNEEMKCRTSRLETLNDTIKQLKIENSLLHSQIDELETRVTQLEHDRTSDTDSVKTNSE